MATHFTIVVEREDSGVFSAYVAGPRVSIAFLIRSAWSR